MFYKIGHRHVLLPAAVPRTFRRQLTKRVRAATNASQHVSETPSPFRSDRSLTALMAQVMTQIGDWWTPTRDLVKDSDILTVDELTDQLQSEMQNASMTEMEVEKTTSDLEKAARPNIWKFLKPVPLEDIQTSRIMASLANASYYLSSRLQFKTILNRYGLHLVTTSLKCKQPATNAKLMDEALVVGDGMAVCEGDLPAQEEQHKLTVSSAESNIVNASDLHGGAGNGTVQNKKSGWTAQFNVGTVAGSVYAQTLAQLARQVTFAATVSQSAVTDSVTRVMSMLQMALRPAKNAKPKETSPAEIRNGGATVEVLNKCPTEWFVCDDKKKETRIFCIQGTDNFESWQTNLRFDPVPFEDDTSGIRVHRGIYEAAKGLYSLFVPLVKDYIEAGPKKKIYFSGHSLGGAIASVLLMMLVHRGDLPVENVGQVFTFGGAASFCDSPDCTTCALKNICTMHDKTSHGPRQTLLERLGLPSHTVVNVIMHKDIVPRAFACDYSLVADLLRKWSHSFRMHECLTIAGRSLLYNFIGEVHVLQPHEDTPYVCKEGYHPMLPQEAALYKLVDPDRETCKLKERMMSLASEAGEIVGEDVANKRDAFLALMDNPHPLDILADGRAYGVHGAISRYHNPLNYSKGLRSISKYKEHTSPHLFGLPLTPPHLPF